MSYDAIGNPLTYDGYTFDWNGRILNSITGNSKTLNFKYNENGLRTEKKVTQNSITTTYNYIWNDGKLVSQSDGTNTFYFFYNDSKYAPDGFVLNGTDNYLYTKNLQGDITGIADANGIIVTTYTYDAWGKIISVTGSQSTTIGTANPFRFRGYYYDTETELYYLQSRYYNPEWGRFLNADDFQQLINNYSIISKIYIGNLYMFCNNSITYIDYTGQSAKAIDSLDAISKIIVLMAIISMLEAYYDSIIITSDQNCKLEREDKYSDKYFKKGKIQIDFTSYGNKEIESYSISFLEIVREIHKLIGDDIFDFIAALANEKFLQRV
ncbi:MAG: RHS repeat domain-containing protein [Acutalibacteraceae bacterium]